MANSVQLKSEDAEGVDEMVASGRYASREAVIAEALRLVRQRDDWRAMVEEKVAEGRAQIARGEGIPIDEAFDRLDARFAIK